MSKPELLAPAGDLENLNLPLLMERMPSMWEGPCSVCGLMPEISTKMSCGRV